MQRVANNERLLVQFGRFVFAASRRNRRRRKHRRIGEGRSAERLDDRVSVAVLAVHEAVRAERQVVLVSEDVDMAVERSRVAGDRKVRDRGEILGDVEVPAVVGHRIGDAVETADRVLVERADLHAPLVIELMLDLHQTGVGGEVGAGARLGEAGGARAHRRGQNSALAAVVDDASRKAVGLRLIVAVVCFDDGLVVDMKVEVGAEQRAIGLASVDVTLALAVHDVEAIADPSASAADIGLLGEQAFGVVAFDEAKERRIGRTLQDVVEHAGRRLRPVERPRKAVENFNAGKVLGGDGCRSNDVQPVEPRVLNDAALKAARLRPRHLVALLIPDFHRGQEAESIVHRMDLLIVEQLLWNHGHRRRRIEDRLGAEGAKGCCRRAVGGLGGVSSGAGMCCAIGSGSGGALPACVAALAPPPVAALGAVVAGCACSGFAGRCGLRTGGFGVVVGALTTTGGSCTGLPAS